MVMGSQDQITTPELKALKEYSSQLYKQDLFLEQIELLLYRMERLAIKALSEKEDLKQQELQIEIESIKKEINQIAIQCQQC